MLPSGSLCSCETFIEMALWCQARSAGRDRGKTKPCLSPDTIMPVAQTQSSLAPICPLTLTDHCSQEVIYPLFLLTILVHMWPSRPKHDILRVTSPQSTPEIMQAPQKCKCASVRRGFTKLGTWTGSLEAGAASWLARKPRFHLLSN